MTRPGPALPEVSVIVPSRDRHRLLVRAVKTALAQRGVVVQVVVVDDGSSDATAEILVGWDDPRLVVVRHDSSTGVARARNDGLARADAPYVAFLDDDDVWSPDKLRAQLDVCSVTGAGWSCTGAVNVTPDLVPLSQDQAQVEGDVLAALLGHNRVPGGASSVLARTALVREVGGFDPAFSTLADWDLWVRLARVAPLAPVRRHLVGYVVHAGSMAHDVRRAEQEHARLTAKHAPLRQECGVVPDRRAWLSYLAAAALRNGDRCSAARLTWRTRSQAGVPRAGALAAACVVMPRTLTAYRGRRARATVPPEVEDWLAPQRDATARTGARPGV